MTVKSLILINHECPDPHSCRTIPWLDFLIKFDICTFYFIENIF